jgi:outer membrane protein
MCRHLILAVILLVFGFAPLAGVLAQQAPPAQQPARPAQQPAPRPAQPQPAQQPAPAQQPQPSPMSQLPPPLPPGQKLPGAVIAVLDLDVINAELSAAKSIREQIERQRTVYRNETTQREEQLRKSREDLERQAPLLSQDARNQRAQQFQNQVQDAERFVAQRLRQLEEAFNESMRGVNQEIGQAMTDIAQERGINLVLRRELGVALSANDLDITTEVFQRVERKIQRVQVRFPPLR